MRDRPLWLDLKRSAVVAFRLCQPASKHTGREGKRIVRLGQGGIKFGSFLHCGFSFWPTFDQRDVSIQGQHGIGIGDACVRKGVFGVEIDRRAEAFEARSNAALRALVPKCR